MNNGLVSGSTIAQAETDIREAAMYRNISEEAEMNEVLNEVIHKYDINFHEVVVGLNELAQQFIS